MKPFKHYVLSSFGKGMLSLLIIICLESNTSLRAANQLSDKTRSKINTPNCRGFVPPPPPVVTSTTTLLFPNNWGINGQIVEYLSLSELKQLQTKYQSQLEETCKTREELRKNLDTKKDRVNLFSSLFAEGVVSRKELESTQSEFTDTEKKLQEIEQKIKDIKLEMAKIVARLKQCQNSKSCGK